jgi:hypothetical protein
MIMYNRVVKASMTDLPDSLLHPLDFSIILVGIVYWPRIDLLS